jgi:hypothetical protein
MLHVAHCTVHVANCTLQQDENPYDHFALDVGLDEDDIKCGRCRRWECCPL